MIPAANTLSMNIHKRFWPVDNADVNRMFPGYDKGEATQRIAADIFEAVSSYDYSIQLASFYLRGKFLPTCASPTRANSRASRLRWRRCSACRARFCTSHRRLTTPHSTTTGKCGTRMRFPCSQKRQGQSMKLRHARLKTASCDLWCTCSTSCRKRLIPHGTPHSRRLLSRKRRPRRERQQRPPPTARPRRCGPGAGCAGSPQEAAALQSRRRWHHPGGR